ncbi:MAG: heme o synthase [Bacteroidia bacterium]|nr:heme o synthase [Bacteroidia bacterium]MBP6720726.1 heme o synthase [Bacteroidia bacterium]MBP8073313.1 heme o synthase [Bacteroidia bacterium]
MQSSNATLTESARTGFPARVKAYVQLVKPRLTLLVVFSAIFGYMMAPNVVGINLWTVIALGLGGFLITGASNTLNQVIEAEYDRLMTRTQNRPMAKKVISPLEGVIFALVCGSAGITLLGLVFEGLVPALLGVIALLLYAFVYTPLKRVNSIAVFVGAFPGAMPPLIGWAAATGTLSTEALVLFLMQFLWQFPHFWAIAWVLEDDYKKAGFKMLPSNAGRSGFTASIILVYTLLLVPVVILPLAVGMSGWITTVVLGLAGAGFSIQAFILLQTRTIKSASRLMFGSFIYLPIVQIAMLIDKF